MSLTALPLRDLSDRGAFRNPYGVAAAVVPADNTLLPGGPTRALYVGVSGDVTVVMEGGSTAVTFKAAPVGVLPIRVQSVNATLTTATSIVALY